MEARLQNGCNEVSRSFRLLSLAPQRRQQLLVYASETAVGHDGDNIARAQFGREVRDDPVRALYPKGRFVLRPDGFDQLIRVEHAPLLRGLLAVEDARDDDVVRGCESVRVILLKDSQARRP